MEANHNEKPTKKPWKKPEIIFISQGYVNSGNHNNAINERTLQHGISIGGFSSVHTPNGNGYPAALYSFVS